MRDARCQIYYQLKPHHEVEPGWWKLSWRPIKHTLDGRHGTWNLYASRNSRRYRKLGFCIKESGVYNGWNRGYDRVDINSDFWFFSIKFWVLYNITCHADGPSDWPGGPLDFPHEISH